jgi:hypothetical protein
MYQPQNPQGSQQPGKQQPNQPYQFPQSGYGPPAQQNQPGQPYPQQPPLHPEVKPLPPNWQQPVPPGQWNPNGVYGGVPEPKKGIPWWGTALILVLAIAVIATLGFAIRAGSSTSTSTPNANNQAQIVATAEPTNTVFSRPANQSANPTPTTKAVPTPTLGKIPVNPNPIVLTGKGTKPSDKIKLPAGLIKVIINYDGPDYFSAMLFNVDTGSEFGWVATGVGKYNGVILGEASKTGNYLFNVSGSGNWKLEIYNSDQLQAQADATGQTPYTVSGQGDTVFMVRFQKTGSYNVKISHKGSSYISVDSYKSDVSNYGLIADGGSGNYEGSRVYKFEEGVYFFNVESSDGTWTITITQ